MRSLRTPLCDLLGIEHPLIQAPMAGGPTTAALVAAVSGAGALGSFGHAYTSPEGIAQAVADARALTDRPFAVNLFSSTPVEEPPGEAQRSAIEALRARFERRGVPVPERVPPPYAPDLAQQVDAICEARPPIFTGHLGAFPPGALARIRDAGIRVGVAATSVREARALEGLGIDFIVAQGGEAGGHRGTFIGEPEHAMTGTLALVRLLVRAVRVPVVAAGGIMDGAGIAAALALGAQAAQLGTAFVVCAESGAPEAHKKAIAGMDGDETSITVAFSGKPARGVRSSFTETAVRDGWPVLPFPVQNKLTAPLRAASARDGAAEDYSAWSGQAGALARPLPAAELVRLLVEEAAETIGHLHQLLERPAPSLG